MAPAPTFILHQCLTNYCLQWLVFFHLEYLFFNQPFFGSNLLPRCFFWLAQCLLFYSKKSCFLCLANFYFSSFRL